MATESVTVEEAASLDFPRLLSGDDIDALEKIAQEWGVHRRLTICTLGKSKAELVQLMESGDEGLAEGMLDLCEASKQYRAHLATLAEQSECAEARLLAALCSCREMQS